MNFDYKSEAVRYIGRWGECGCAMAATAAGAKIQIAFTGDRIVLKFAIAHLERLPHIKLSLDGESFFEANLDRYLSVTAPTGEHLLTVIYKGGKECHNRWEPPQLNGILFEGFEADGIGTLPPLNKKTIELIGDSITEGVVLDAYLDCGIGADADEYSKPVQDDFTSTYASVACRILNLEPIGCGYGAVGVTKSGCGGVPKAADMYDYAFGGTPVTYESPDYILINHGTNDQSNKNTFTEDYEALLLKVSNKHSRAKIACMIPFCGAFNREIPAIIEKFNREHNTDIKLVDTAGWLPLEPIHPNRAGHKAAGEKLAEILKGMWNL